MCDCAGHEFTCPSCGAVIRSHLGDQAMIDELKKQGWRKPAMRSAIEAVWLFFTYVGYFISDWWRKKR